MTIVTLFLYVGIVALILTFLVMKIKKDHFSFLDSYLQNFAGALFIFSGMVKAVDPMGTAFKMEQYFTAFEDTCSGSFLSPIAALFPFLSEYALSFSVFMIVLEIVLGIMLILGYQRKLTVWLFFLIMVFFTILTGFTYLTGYVPTEANFFDFGSWTEFNKNQMRVTDCGCFGDFIKLEPRVSFNKDLILMIPAIWFLFRWRTLHQLFSPALRKYITLMATVALFLFCLANFVWNEPMIDFRPFRSGVNIKEQLELEQQALAEVEILAFRIKNKETGIEMEVPYASYLDSFKLYPNFKSRWETLDQIKSEPKIPRSKISDFDLLSLDGQSMTEFILNDSRYNFVILSPKVLFESVSVTEEMQDSVYILDTITIKNGGLDSTIVTKTLDTVQTRTIKRNSYTWDPEFISIIKEKILPLLDSVRSENVIASAVFGGLTEEGIADLRSQAGIDFPCYEADDLLLKTIMRSNPGLLLLKEGKVIHKWHHRQLPSIEDLRIKYLNAVGNALY